MYTERDCGFAAKFFIWQKWRSATQWKQMGRHNDTGGVNRGGSDMCASIGESQAVTKGASISQQYVVTLDPVAALFYASVLLMSGGVSRLDDTITVVRSFSRVTRNQVVVLLFLFLILHTLIYAVITT